MVRDCRNLIGPGGIAEYDDCCIYRVGCAVSGVINGKCLQNVFEAVIDNHLLL